MSRFGGDAKTNQRVFKQKLRMKLKNHVFLYSFVSVVFNDKELLKVMLPSTISQHCACTVLAFSKTEHEVIYGTHFGFWQILVPSSFMTTW